MKRDTSTYGAERPAWDKNDCSVRALATATGVSYPTASAVFSAIGRRLKAGTSIDLSSKLYEEILGMKRITLLQGMRLDKLVELAPSGSYLVHKRGHAFAVIDGVVHDWENTSKGSTKLLSVWKVTDKAKAKMLAMSELLG